MNHPTEHNSFAGRPGNVRALEIQAKLSDLGYEVPLPKVVTWSARTKENVEKWMGNYLKQFSRLIFPLPSPPMCLRTYKVKR